MLAETFSNVMSPSRQAQQEQLVSEMAQLQSLAIEDCVTKAQDSVRVHGPAVVFDRLFKRVVSERVLARRQVAIDDALSRWTARVKMDVPAEVSTTETQQKSASLAADREVKRPPGEPSHRARGRPSAVQTCGQGSSSTGGASPPSLSKPSLDGRERVTRSEPIGAGGGASPIGCSSPTQGRASDTPHLPALGSPMTATKTDGIGRLGPNRSGSPRSGSPRSRSPSNAGVSPGGGRVRLGSFARDANRASVGLQDAGNLVIGNGRPK